MNLKDRPRLVRKEVILEEHSAGEELEETSLMEPEGGFLKPYFSFLQCIIEYVWERRWVSVMNRLLAG